MADRIYGLSRGQTEFDVSEDSSSTTDDVEVVVDLAKSLSKAEVLMLLDQIKAHIVKGNWPPA